MTAVVESQVFYRTVGNNPSPMETSYNGKKLFIGGLSWETTETDLRTHFEKFGIVDSVSLKTDPNTGKSRGFGFVVFQEGDSIDAVNQCQDHVINGRRVNPQVAKAKLGKVFVGGLSPTLSNEDIKHYFSQFGNVVDVQIPVDKITNQRKKFCFITFDSEKAARDLLINPRQVINGVQVDVKKATPRGNVNNPTFPSHQPYGQRRVERSYDSGWPRADEASYGRSSWNDHSQYGSYQGSDSRYGWYDPFAYNSGGMQ